MEELRELLWECLTPNLYQIVLSGATDRTAPLPAEEVRPLHFPAQKRKVRPVMLKGELLFQVTSYDGSQVFHENMTSRQAAEALAWDMMAHFKQLQAEGSGFSMTVAVSKKGKVTVKRKKSCQEETRRVELSHNRTKRYLLQEGKPVLFLVDLGVQTPDGRIVHSRYDKFRQINRFLEFIEDILPILPKDREISILDFGCGKSYLTFAMYHYLHEIQGLALKITGLDLKEDVIANCNALAQRYGYDGLHFLCGDIADYEQKEKVDMVVTLHACDTATDHALYRAVKWGARVILSVPRCQHELNRRIENRQLEGALRYGLIKERLSALFTDALRADLLEEQGYDTQILEFIDMEHTPKNILIRAVKRENPKTDRTRKESEVLSGFLHARITLQDLLEGDRGEGV